MRIAAVSDIHGNLGALEAVLTDVKDQRVDLIVNLGDTCSDPLQPQETLELLRGLAIPTIAGNHERQLLTLPIVAMGPSDRHAARSLTEEQFGWLRDLPATLRPVEGVLMVHGTVRSDLEYLLNTVTHKGCARRLSRRSRSEHWVPRPHSSCVATPISRDKCGSPTGR